MSLSRRASRRCPDTTNSPSLPISWGSRFQIRRARIASGSCTSGRPWVRTPP